MGLTFIAIVLLAGAWAAILLPDLRNRGGAPRRNNSVKSFRQQLSGLDRTRPQGSAYRPGLTTPRPGMAQRPGVAPRPATTSRAPVARTPSPAPRPRTGAAPGPVARHRPTPAPAPRSSMMPRTRAEAAKRRMLTLAVLAALAVITLLGGLVLSRTLLFVHLIVDALLAGVVYLAWERAQRAGARRTSLVTLGGQERAAAGRLDDDATVTPLVRRASGS